MSTKAALVLNGQKELTCGSMDNDVSSKLAIVSIGMDFARPLVALTNFKWKWGSKLKGGTLVASLSSVGALAC